MRTHRSQDLHEASAEMGVAFPASEIPCCVRLATVNFPDRSSKLTHQELDNASMPPRTVAVAASGLFNGMKDSSFTYQS